MSLIVWRVPKETSVESVRRMRAGSTSARAAASAASRGRPPALPYATPARMGSAAGVGTATRP
ncbi:MAG: hypothetical protein HOQ34_08765, partial [Gemmatimonadaceae bacterium]|nr:hypothetical protein [Gemmatimonadaceae bacterium]